MYDIIILGSGPAGLTAALYAARANKKTLVLAGPELGGQANIIHSLENYPGFRGTGSDFAEVAKKQVLDHGAEIVMASAKSVTGNQLPVTRDQDQSGHGSLVTGYHILADNGTEYKSRAVIIATGAKPRRLDIKGAREYAGRGLSYCATCDGFFYSGKDVIVVGGGNSALSDALYLANLAKTVTIVYRKDAFARAEEIQVDRVNETPNIRKMFSTELAEVGGDGAVLTHVVTTAGEKINCDGVFIAIGHEANTDFLSEEFKRDAEGRLIPESLPDGMYVAGDVRANIKMQVAAAVGTGCECAISAIERLNMKKQKNYI